MFVGRGPRTANHAASPGRLTELPRSANAVESELPSVVWPVRRPVRSPGSSARDTIALVLKLMVDRVAGRIANAPLVVAHEGRCRRENDGGRSAVLPIAIVAVPGIRLSLLEVPMMLPRCRDALATIRVVWMRVVAILGRVANRAKWLWKRLAVKAGDILGRFLPVRESDKSEVQDHGEQQMFGHD